MNNAFNAFTKYCMPIPTWALCYIFNDDATGLSDDEIRMVDSFIRDNRFEIITPCDMEDEGSFTTCPAFGLPADCIECWCMMRKHK